jgi:hypothetical protein
VDVEQQQDEALAAPMTAPMVRVVRMQPMRYSTRTTASASARPRAAIRASNCSARSADTTTASSSVG